MNITLHQQSHEQIENALWAAISEIDHTTSTPATIIKQCRDAISTISIARIPGPELPRPTQPAAPSVTGEIVHVGDLGPKLTGMMIRIDREKLKAFHANLAYSTVTITPVPRP